MNQLYRLLLSASDRVNRLVEWSLFGIGASMAFLISLQVFFRYVLNHSLFWSEELGRMFLVWLTFLGATVAYKRKAHVGIDFLVIRMPFEIQRWLHVIVLAGSLFFFWIMAYYGYHFFDFIRLQTTAALGFSKQIPFVMVPVSGCILILHALVFLLEIFSGKEEGS